MEYVAGFVIGFALRPFFDMAKQIVKNAWEETKKGGQA